MFCKFLETGSDISFFMSKHRVTPSDVRLCDFYFYNRSVIRVDEIHFLNQNK